MAGGLTALTIVLLTIVLNTKHSPPTTTIQLGIASRGNKHRSAIRRCSFVLIRLSVSRLGFFHRLRD
ncbi:hypothetical protein BU26DRAFT_168752 [Trematosphaeria pertusa]|uniref:Secreted protein n=1 Tax=Trematosphaeria pertusa TaxID=390896 RepID=A0A6A6HVW1_9PLEO|nr:uncharacterized protein BU26DRAFT_168752 [Trematosphaeria pertusa]KAF2241693.1 hypothetical protein BU26DRAFT_168752 [Trematosphaeria pertusa]